MGFWLSLIYVSLLFISIGDTFPVLAPYRVQLVTGIGALLATIAGALATAKPYVLQTCRNLQYVLMVTFTAFVLISWWPHLWLGGFFVGLYGFLPSAILFFLIGLGTYSTRRLRLLRIVLLGTALYIVGHGLYDYYFVGPASRFLLSHDLPDGGLEIRLKGLGLLGDPNQYAQFLLSLLPFLFIGWKERSPLVKVGQLLPIAVLMLWAIFLSLSRGALVSLALLLFLTLRRRFTALGGIGSALLAVVLLLAANFTGSRQISLAGGVDRLACWSEGLGLFKSSPLWGVGYNGFLGNFELTAHNSFVLCFAELGLLGYFLWIGLILVSVWQLRTIRDSTGPEAADPELRSWASATLIALYVLLTTAFFLSQTYAPPLYVLLGIAAAIIGIDVRQRNKPLLPEKSRWGLWTLGTCFGSIVVIYLCVISRAF